jgi:hypothetical protein
MPAPLTKLQREFVDGSRWTPGDSNDVSMASRRFQDAFAGGKHDEDGFHTRDFLVPIESARVHWTGAAYAIQETTADSTLSVAPGGAPGYVQLTFGAMNDIKYLVLVRPIPSGTEVVSFFEDGNFTRTVTDCQVIIFNDAGNFVDRDFIVHVFGARG